LLELVLGHVAVAARAAELQHQREALVGERLLRTVASAFGKVGDRSGMHLAVGGEVKVAFELEAHLVEVMAVARRHEVAAEHAERDRKSTRLNSSHVSISYAVFCLKKKK